MGWFNVIGIGTKCKSLAVMLELKVIQPIIECNVKKGVSRSCHWKTNLATEILVRVLVFCWAIEFYPRKK